MNGPEFNKKSDEDDEAFLVRHGILRKERIVSRLLDCAILWRFRIRGRGSLAWPLFHSRTAVRTAVEDCRIPNPGGNAQPTGQRVSVLEFLEFAEAIGFDAAAAIRKIGAKPKE